MCPRPSRAADSCPWVDAQLELLPTSETQPQVPRRVSYVPGSSPTRDLVRGVRRRTAEHLRRPMGAQSPYAKYRPKTTLHTEDQYPA